MPTSTRFVVSVHALAMLAVQGGGPVRSEDMAASIGTNPAVVRALLARLAAAGLTSSQLGNGGGALLSRPPEEVTLLDVFLAMEEREIFSFHRSPPGGSDVVGRHIAESLAAPLRVAREAMEASLASVTIRSIVDQVDRLALASRT